MGRMEEVLAARGPFRCPRLGVRMTPARCCLRQYGIDPVLSWPGGAAPCDARLSVCATCDLGRRILARELAQSPSPPSFSSKDVPRCVIAVRRRLGLTQAGLAARLRVCQQTVSRWERGLSLPRAPVTLALTELCP